MPVDLKRAQTVFLAAVECDDAAGRAAVLDRECSPDAEMRQWVESLLWAHDRPVHLLEQPFTAPATRVTGIGPETDDEGAPGGEAETGLDFTVAATPAPDGETAGEGAMVFDDPAPPPVTEGPGTRIGPYRLGQKLGEGAWAPSTWPSRSGPSAGESR